MIDSINDNSLDSIISFLEKEFSGLAKPKTAIILGSGIEFRLAITKPKEISYSQIPNMPKTSVQGHKGQLVLAQISATESVLLFSGRYHLYEGWPADKVWLPVLIADALGVKNLLLTNSAGGINTGLAVADLMLIEGINNFQIPDEKTDSRNGLLANISSPPLNIQSNLTQQIKKNFQLSCGNYAAVLGPNYETLSEINLFKSLNCSAVGMSTYLEAKKALELNMNLAAVSVITNIWGSETAPSHQEVLDNSKKANQMINQVFEFVISAN